MGHEKERGHFDKRCIAALAETVATSGPNWPFYVVRLPLKVASCTCILWAILAKQNEHQSSTKVNNNGSISKQLVKVPSEQTLSIIIRFLNIFTNRSLEPIFRINLLL